MHEVFHRVKALENEFHQLFVGGNLKFRYLAELAQHLVAFSLYHSVVDVALVFEISVDGATSLLGGDGDVVHRRVFNALVGKELTGNVD